MGEVKLTDEQRQLITDNHNVIYKYMHDKGIDLEYYGEFAEKLCRSIHLYDANRGKISTFIYCVCDAQRKNILKHKYSACRYISRERQVSLDAVVFKEHSQTLQDILGFDDDGYNNVDEEDIIAKIRTELKLRYPDDTITDGVLNYILKGYNHREVGDIYGVSRQAINVRVQKIRKIYEKIKEREEL